MSASQVPEGSTTPKEYVAEKIVASRINEQGKREYYLKWVGCDDTINTWKLEENLDCRDLIEAFKAQEEVENTKRKVPSPEARPAKIKKEEGAVGFDRNLLPERIVGATEVSGQLMFLIQWEGTMEADLVPASQVNIRFPQMVISFYEEHLKWKSANSDDED